jgi:hypothetical protein
VLTINVAVLLAVIIVVRLRRRTEARSRNDEQVTVLIVLVFGVLVTHGLRTRCRGRGGTARDRAHGGGPLKHPAGPV